MQPRNFKNPSRWEQYWMIALMRGLRKASGQGRIGHPLIPNNLFHFRTEYRGHPKTICIQQSKLVIALRNQLFYLQGVTHFVLTCPSSPALHLDLLFLFLPNGHQLNESVLAKVQLLRVDWMERLCMEHGVTWVWKVERATGKGGTSPSPQRILVKVGFLEHLEQIGSRFSSLFPSSMDAFRHCKQPKFFPQVFSTTRGLPISSLKFLTLSCQNYFILL